MLDFKAKLWNNKYGNFHLDAIAYYDKNKENKIIWKIKDLKEINIEFSKKIFIENYYLCEFKKKLDEIILKVKKLNNIPVVIFPPTKPNKKNQVIELLKILKFNFSEVEFIELESKINFELKYIKTMSEREEFLKNNYKDFIFKFSNGFIKNEDKNFYIFVDDIIINGLFMFYCMKKVSESLDNRIMCEGNPPVKGIFIAKTRQQDNFYSDSFKALKNEWIS